jgi:hypothetical protein
VEERSKLSEMLCKGPHGDQQYAQLILIVEDGAVIEGLP